MASQPKANCQARSLEEIKKALKQSMPEIAQRHKVKLIHVYFGIDKEVVWQTLQEDLPPLQQSMKKILQDFCSER